MNQVSAALCISTLRETSSARHSGEGRNPAPSKSLKYWVDWILAFAGMTGLLNVCIEVNSSIGELFEAIMAGTPRQHLSFAFFIRETISCR